MQREGTAAMNQLRNRHFFLADLVLLALAVYLSFVLRLEQWYLAGYSLSCLLFGGLVLLLVPLLFRRAGMYARYWRYASIEEVLLLSGTLTLATALAAVLALGGIPLLTQGSTVLPRSVPVIFWLLALVATAAPRLIVRTLTGRRSRGARPGAVDPVLVVGAGDAGTMIVRELRRNARIGMEVVGFVDDDPAKQQMRIHGVPVLGTRHELPLLVERYQVRRVIIAMPTAAGKVIREIVHRCEQAGVQTRTIPGIYELLDRTVSITQLRTVQIEDLLRREPIQTDIAAVRGLLQGKRVLITGGGGSIGSELCRQVLRCDPATILILGHGENSVFEITTELQRLLHGWQSSGERNGKPTTRIVPVIADIRFAERMRAIFAEYQPEVVFHAAAHKHVPLMEVNPGEAITNNVLGTRNVLDSALAVGVEHFVMISSDKAVNPTSVMGVSKRVAELLVHQAATRSGKPYVTVRFGNVLGSRGSVILTFKQQIAAGGPVTVTHPEMRRFFMTIPEAVQLVLQAGVLGHGGEVFMCDMGEPVRIVDLARDMIELSGLEEGRDIDIVFTGMRPGEKLFEELFLPGEVYQATKHPKISIAVNDSTFVPPQLNEAIYRLEVATQHHDKATILTILKQLIPEFGGGAAGSEHGQNGQAASSVLLPSCTLPHITEKTQ
jgi:FlaA1/EpsC-like NDP-sugar epimerase